MAVNKKVELSSYDNSWYNPGSHLRRTLWFLFNGLFFINPLFPFSNIKCHMLRMFGAKLGEGVLLKPRINIKHPWMLEIGNNCWIGENVWIDNLAPVTIKDNVCLSQGSMLLCGNHNYNKTSFDLVVKPIVLEEGVWIGARATVTPGTICKSHSVVTLKSVAVKTLEPYGIYSGNPAQLVKYRKIL